MRAIVAPSSRSRIRVRNRKLDSGVTKKPGESRAFSLCSACFLAVPVNVSAPSFRRRPESILILSLTWCASREPAHVPVWFRPPSWRPSHFLCLPKESNQRNAPSRSRSRGHPCPRDCASRLRGLRTVRPCTGRKLAAILAAIAARLFLRLLAATWRGPGEKQSAAVPAAEALLHRS